MRDYCALTQNCEEYLLDTEKLLLNEDFVYIKATTGELSVPYVAVMGVDFREETSISNFFMTLVHKVAQYLPPESRIRPILYEQNFLGTFDPDALLHSLEELEPGSRQRPQQVAPPALESSNRPLPPPAKVERPFVPPVPSASMPKPPVEKVVPPSAQSGGSILSSLFSGGKAKKPKDVKKEEGKHWFGGKKAKNQLPENFESPFPIPGMSSYGAESPVPAGDGVGFPSIEHKSSPMPLLGSRDAPQAQAASAQTPHSFVGGKPGYTINWNDMDSGVPGGTVLMPENAGKPGDTTDRTPVLWLVHRGDGHREQVTGNNFHVGRKQGYDEIVDYAVMNATGYMGADHAYFQIRDNKFYMIDNNSKNGTWLNEERLQPSVPYELHSGDVVKMADEVFDLDMR